MAKTVTLYNVFVASPSDVKEEREALEEIIREFNLTTANHLSIKLELIRWETHIYPSFGEDAQDVINHQIRDDYDVFIGIMWSRFGSPTGRYDSGTKEEFERAFERWKEKKGKDITIMFYFKNAPIMPEQIDIEQIQFLKQFKLELSERGGLYWTFNSVENFKSLLRVHLNKAISDLVSSNPVLVHKELSPETTKKDDSAEDEGEQEIAVLDSLEFALDEFSDSWQSIDKMSAYMQELTARINERTESLNRLNSSSESAKIREGRRIIDLVADDMMNYVNRTRVELPIFKASYEKGMTMFSELYSFWKIADDSSEQLNNIQDKLRYLKELMSLASENSNRFKDVVAGLANMTAPFTKAKKQTVKVLEEVISELNNAARLIEDFETGEQ